MKTFIYLWLATSFFTPRLCCQQPSIGIAIYPSIQTTAPLQVVGLRDSGSDNRGLEVIVKNITDKQIRAFIVVPIARGVCFGKEEAKVSVRWRLEDTIVQPNAQAVAREDAVRMGPFIWFALSKKTPYVAVEVGVVHVEFTDGTTWKTDEEHLVSTARMDMEKRRCMEWRTSSADLVGIREDAAVGKDPSGHVDVADDRYFVACKLSSNGSIMCPTF